MQEQSSKSARVDKALRELDLAISEFGAGREEMRFYGPTVLASMNRREQDSALQAESQRYRADPEGSAMHLCLTSAVALLEVAQMLLNPTRDPTPQEVEWQLKNLVANTKTAGRSAYRAASILTDQKKFEDPHRSMPALAATSSL